MLNMHDSPLRPPSSDSLLFDSYYINSLPFLHSTYSPSTDHRYSPHGPFRCYLHRSSSITQLVHRIASSHRRTHSQPITSRHSNSARDIGKSRGSKETRAPCHIASHRRLYNSYNVAQSNPTLQLRSQCTRLRSVWSALARICARRIRCALDFELAKKTPSL